MSIAADFKEFQQRKIQREFAAFRKTTLKGERGELGPQGPQGAPGESVLLEEVVTVLLNDPQFIEAVRGSDGRDGHDGTDGKDGEEGLTPKEDELIEKIIKSEELRKKLIGLLPMGGLGVSPTVVNLIRDRVTALENNPSGGLAYLSLTDAGTKTYTSSDFIFGTNIIGVNAPGAVTIQLPQTLTAGTVIKIKDESLSALTNNITVETYLEV